MPDRLPAICTPALTLTLPAVARAAPRDVNNDDNGFLDLGPVSAGVARMVISRDATNHYRLKVYAGPDYDNLSLLGMNTWVGRREA